jgi:hypothetical protein
MMDFGGIGISPVKKEMESLEECTSYEFEMKLQILNESTDVPNPDTESCKLI